MTHGNESKLTIRERIAHTKDFIESNEFIASRMVSQLVNVNKNSLSSALNNMVAAGQLTCRIETRRGGLVYYYCKAPEKSTWFSEPLVSSPSPSIPAYC